MNRVVSIDVRHQNVEDVLLRLFDNTKISYKVMENNLIVIAPSGLAQQQTQVKA